MLHVIKRTKPCGRGTAKPQPPIARAEAFARAVTGQRADDATVHRRMAACGECDRLVRDGDALYCGACGCPNWRLSELRTKLRFVNLTCPHPEGPRW